MAVSTQKTDRGRMAGWLRLKERRGSAWGSTKTGRKSVVYKSQPTHLVFPLSVAHRPALETVPELRLGAERSVAGGVGGHPKVKCLSYILCEQVTPGRSNI